MIGFLNALCRSFFGLIAGPLCDIVDGIKVLWRTLKNFFHIIRRAWHDLGPALRHYLAYASDFQDSVLRVVWRLVNKFIPKAFKDFWKWAWRIIRDLIRLTVAAIKEIIKELRHWARKAIDALWNVVKPFVKWATRHINEWIHWLDKYLRKTVDLVLHPFKLATWIVPALLEPLTKFIIKRRFDIGRFFLRTSLRVALETASIVERVLVKLL